MKIIKEFIQDNKHIYQHYGLKFLLIVYLKLAGYLLAMPLLNLFFFWKIWPLGILQLPFTYLGFVIALQGASGVSTIQIKLFRALNTVKAWIKK